MYIKLIIIFAILLTSIRIGSLISKKYINRVIELQEFKSALNIFKTKIKYTYEPITDIFNEISSKFENNVSTLFKNVGIEMKTKSAGEAWDVCLETTALNVKDEDKRVLKNLGKLLGKTDKDGQINEIEVTEEFLDLQIKKAQEERQKNEKLYKTLGVICGLAFGIILI
ncbi:MAG: stage III sporulation protein AB [Oscillospiraceae bacterium]|nr:stage III sporulation protein AB [Oscillospiraceae bacterium]